MNCLIWYEVAKEEQLSNDCPFLETQYAETVDNDPNWPNGFKYLEQNLSTSEFGMVDTAANNYIAIDVQEFQPSKMPPYSPTGR